MFNKKNYIQNRGVSLSAQLDIPAQAYDPVLQEPTVLAGLRLITSIVLSMPLTAKYKDAIYSRYTKPLPLELELILIKPNYNETISQLIANIVGQLVIHNECFLQIRKGGIGTTGLIEFIECLEHTQVQRYKDTSGRWCYNGLDNAGKAIIQSEIHYLTNTRLGFQNLNLLKQASNIISLSNQSINHAESFYEQAPKTSGWFTTESRLADDQFTRLKDQINNQANQTGYALIENVTFTPNQYNFKDAMSFETRKTTTQDLCSLMGVPPSMLGLEWASSNSLDEVRSIFMSSTISPIVNAIEECLNNALLSRGIEVDFDEKGVLNSSYIERSKLANDQFKLGLISKNEARVDLEQLSDEDGGNQYVIDSNNLTLGGGGETINTTAKPLEGKE